MGQGELDVSELISGQVIEYSTLEVAEHTVVGRSTVYRAIERQRIAAKADLADASRRR